MFITFIFLANILLLVQPAASYLYGGTSNDVINIQDLHKMPQEDDK
ncbi:hypothetical protein T02_16194 [Trichinella nativa]|uniref:Uncharacterized protein n=1 Tax=Trichinella nativa TaxID=6335 RepID=A0A0V1KM80_9BILA|nr:hypothetical protein T02_16194 [Trichinella nativa]